MWKAQLAAAQMIGNMMNNRPGGRNRSNSKGRLAIVRPLLPYRARLGSKLLMHRTPSASHASPTDAYLGHCIGPDETMQLSITASVRCFRRTFERAWYSRPLGPKSAPWTHKTLTRNCFFRCSGESKRSLAERDRAPPCPPSDQISQTAKKILPLYRALYRPA